MAKAFARITRIGDSQGRSNYISDPKRQENIVLHSTEHMHNSWSDYSKFEEANKKNDKDNLEAREIIIHLPRDLDAYPDELKEIMDDYCLKTLGNNRDFEYAVHWNKDETNLHAHILFSDRERVTEREPKIYKKDFWYDKETNRLAKANAPGAELRFKKGEVQRDKETGEIKYNDDSFTKKDRFFKSQDFNEQIKLNQVEILNAHHYKFRMHDPKTEIAQEHVGNKYQRDEVTQIKTHARNKQIREMNVFLKENNLTVKDYLDKYKDLFKHNEAKMTVKALESEVSILEKKYSELDRQEKALFDKLAPYFKASQDLKSATMQKKHINKDKPGFFDFKGQATRNEQNNALNDKIANAKAIVKQETPTHRKLSPQIAKIRELKENVGKQLNNARNRLKQALMQDKKSEPKRESRSMEFTMNELKKKHEAKQREEQKKDKNISRGRSR